MHLDSAHTGTLTALIGWPNPKARNAIQAWYKLGMSIQTTGLTLQEAVLAASTHALARQEHNAKPDTILIDAQIIYQWQPDPFLLTIE